MFLLRLDDQRKWYRYHQLFADFLRNGLDATERRELHLRASAWHEQQGFIEDAFRHDPFTYRANAGVFSSYCSSGVTGSSSSQNTIPVR